MEIRMDEIESLGTAGPGAGDGKETGSCGQDQFKGPYNWPEGEEGLARVFSWDRTVVKKLSSVEHYRLKGELKEFIFSTGCSFVYVYTQAEKEGSLKHRGYGWECFPSTTYMKPIGVAVAVRTVNRTGSEKYSLGWSLCSGADPFDRTIGRVIAIERAAAAKGLVADLASVPEKMKPALLAALRKVLATAMVGGVDFTDSGKLVVEQV